MIATRRTMLGLMAGGAAAATACSAQERPPQRSSSPRRLARAPYIHELFTGVGRGDPVIDTAAFELAARTGLFKLAPGVRYVLRRGVRIRKDDAGFVCDTGTATIAMLTAAGEFDLGAQEDGKAYGPSHVGLDVLNVQNVVLAGIDFELQSNRDVRCAIAVAIRGGSNALIDSCSARGFDLPWRGIFTLQSCPNARLQSIAVRDCGSSKDIAQLLKDGRGRAAQPQVTGIEIDNDTLGGVWSSNAAINGVVVERLELTGAASLHGQQTDAVNIQSKGDCGITVSQLRTSRVGEALDNFSSGMVARDIIADDTYFSPIKLIHGASRCRVEGVRIRRTGFSGVQIANAVGATVEYNEVSGVTADDIGIHHDRWCPVLALPAGVYFDGGAPDVQGRKASAVSNNVVRGTFNGHADRMPVLARQISPEAASTAFGNRFIGDGSGYSALAEVIGEGGALRVNGRLTKGGRA